MNQDLAAASKLIETVPPAGDTQLDQVAARLYMATQKWPAAALVLARRVSLNANDLSARTQLNLARNLTAVRDHRPALYETLVHTPPSGHHALHRMPTGQLTVTRSRPDDQNNPLLLCTGPVPDAAARTAVAALAPAIKQGNALGLNGIADGHFLFELAKTKPLPLNRCSAVHVFEPEAELVMQTMMIHDFSAADGPIQQPRFQWHVGPAWAKSYETAMLTGTLTLPEPATIAQLSGDPQVLKALLTAVQNKGEAQSKRVKARIDAWYADYSPEQFKQRCVVKGEGQSRANPPRVLLVTSRFTTVLQHETRRIAEAFETLGWLTSIAIEPDDHHRMLTGELELILDRFKPDLLFTIDHLRSEQGKVIPRNLPYCCWVQDLLPNLTTADAGKSVGDNDWVISFCTPLLVGRYAYPPSRVIDAPIMLASEPALPSHWQNDGPDLAYVSNLSQTTDELIAQTLQHAATEDHPLLRQCAKHMISCYQEGQSLPSKTDIGRLITPLLNTHFKHIAENIDLDKATMFIIDRLWNPLNIGLYRQQALTWIAQIADEHNLSLAIFGRGWEQHPRFAQYAQGVIHPGAPLQQLVRSTKINLNLEPYPCTTHVRLLDGLTAGGFYLVRHHPANTLLPQLAHFINQHAPAAVNDAQAHAMTPPSHREALRDLLARTAGVSYDHPPDVVAQMRCYQNANVMRDDQPLLPGLDDISFHDFETCKQRILAFIAEDASRQNLRDKQRDAVASRLTLRQGLSRIIKHMQQGTIRTQHQNTCNALSA